MSGIVEEGLLAKIFQNFARGADMARDMFHLCFQMQEAKRAGINSILAFTLENPADGKKTVVLIKNGQPIEGTMPSNMVLAELQTNFAHAVRAAKAAPETEPGDQITQIKNLPGKK